ncbi:MAG: hypothetical protein ABEJ27_07940 [Halodesulfurarchaeum sp.]
MPEIQVPAENRPNVGRYIGYAAVAFVLIGFLTLLMVSNSQNSMVSLVTLSVAGLADLAVLFLLVQSLVEAWFEAAEVVEG